MLLTATSANVAQPGVPVRIQILRWSTDQERTPVLEAFTAPPPAPARGRGAAGRDGAPGREGAAGRAGAAGAARGGGAPAAPAAAARGRGRGAAPAAPQTPEERLEAALMKAPTVGYIWTSDVTGYSIKYAYRLPSSGSGERIILITDRRLGEYNPAWKLKGTAVSPDYEFTLVEIRNDGKTEQGKTTLTNKIVVDNEAKTLALDDFASAPALLQNVKRQSGS
jgi:hypothetical protein